MWTSATASEIRDLLTSDRLRRQLDDFLGFASRALKNVDTLLVFGEECVHLALTLGLGRRVARRLGPAKGYVDR